MLQKKEVIKDIKGEKRLLTFDKNGKLTSDELYSDAGVKLIQKN